MPNDASGKGSADAASKSRLTKTQLDAILSLAAAGDVEPKAEAAQPDARGAAGPAHVAIWDTVNEVRLSGANAPTTETLAAQMDLQQSLLVAESGIQSHEDVQRLTAAGARAILVGEALMREADISAKVRELGGQS